MKKRWYNIELEPEDWYAFKAVLIRDGEETGEKWKVESSGCGELVHVEIECAPSELEYLNELLQEIW